MVAVEESSVSLAVESKIVFDPIVDRTLFVARVERREVASTLDELRSVVTAVEVDVSMTVVVAVIQLDTRVPADSTDWVHTESPVLVVAGTG